MATREWIWGCLQVVQGRWGPLRAVWRGQQRRTHLFSPGLSRDPSLAPFPPFLLLSFSPLWVRAGFHGSLSRYALSLCSGNLPSEFLLLINSNPCSSAKVAHKRNRLGCLCWDVDVARPQCPDYLVIYYSGYFCEGFLIFCFERSI